MSYKDGIANKTGRLGEAEADQYFKENGLYSSKPPGLDYGIDRTVSLNGLSITSAKIQIKGRSQIENPRWFQLTLTGPQLRDAFLNGEDLNQLWKNRIYMVDFWILVSIPYKEIWVFPSHIIHEIADLNYRRYHTRQDNNYSQLHKTKNGKVAKKQKELNLDIFDKNGIQVSEIYHDYKNNINPLLEFLHSQK